MNRLFTIVASTVVASLVGSPPQAQAQFAASRRIPADDVVQRVARSASAFGHIQGVVLDERGAPLPGAAVSAYGSSSVTAITDKRGAFVLRSLPAGTYLVRAQRIGFLPSRRQFVQVAGRGPTHFSLTMQRADRVGETPGILAAGMIPGSSGQPLTVAPADEPDSTGTSDDHSETAWRLRHLKRSILKETERAALDEAPAEPDGIQPGTVSFIARALGTSAHLFGELPFTGEVNFITSGSFDGASPVQSGAVPLRQVAFLSVGGPAWRHGDWSAQVMAQGDLGSWFLGGSYRKRAPASHVYDVGVSYSTQRFTPGSRWPIAVGSEGARSAGAIYGGDLWTLSPRATLAYGARFARYDYLGGPGLFSPRVTLTLIPARGLRVHGTLSRRMLAPGAEEFLEPLVSGLWVPPERTFLGVAPLVAERTHHVEAGVEQDLPHNFVLAIRGFYQLTGNQQVAVFGLNATPAGATGHYVVGNGGDVNARGWAVAVSNMLSSHVRGSVAYTVTRAHWLPGATTDYGLLLVGPGARPGSERLHDVTTTLETDIPATATRVFLAYKLNTAFAKRQAEALWPGVGTRFDVQVVQRLPFLDFTSAQWQVMFAVRNLFRDTTADASIYDELLVVQPPKRVVTGLLVRF
jgi:hypothetical protein